LKNACLVFQVISDARIPNSKLLLEINAIDEGGIAGNLMLPPGFRLGKGVDLRIGASASAAHFSFTTCLPEGCVARIAFNKQELELLQKSTQVDLAIQIMSGETMHFLFDLRGFRYAFNQMNLIMNPYSQTTDRP
jgi:invasion protein IalB